MSAFAGVSGGWNLPTNVKQSTSTSNTNYTPTNTGTDKQTAKKAKSGIDAFKEWLEKLFDWVEVRVERLEYTIDLYQAKAENNIGYTAKNSLVQSAFNTTRQLISDATKGADKYLEQAEKVREKAVKLGVVSNDRSKDLVKLIKSGEIQISEYDEKTREFINDYKEWFDKSLELTAQVEDLKTQLKELEQTKLDNITAQFEALASWSDAVSARAQAMGEFLTSAGRTVNASTIKSTFGTQINEANFMIGRYKDELKAFADELATAKTVFGESSNEYREAMAQYEEINQQLIEASTQYNELNKQLYELDLTKLEYVMDRLEAFGDKLSSIVSLKETRGRLFGASANDVVNESDYSQQVKANNDIIKLMAEDRQKRIAEIAKFGWDIDSENYKEAYDAIMNDEKEILNLLESNEDLKQSIRALRWKPFEEFEKIVEEAIGDYDHLRELITDNEKFDDEDGIFMTARGYADLALLANQIAATQNKIADYRKALDKLQEEYKNGNISLETFNETSREYIDTVQQSVTAVDGYKEAIIEMYKTQITNENDALQKTISLRKDALSAKKAYYDYDKTLSEKNKDIAQLRAQINALSGVTNQQAQAQRAKLQAQLAEAEEDLRDTLIQHQYDATSQGYDQLSEDSQEALDNTIKQLEANAEQQDQIVNMMLERLRTHYSDAYGAIQDIISSTGTVIGDVADASINRLETTADKIISLAKAMDEFQTQAYQVASSVNTSTITTADSAVKAVEATIKANNTDATIANAKASTTSSSVASTPQVKSSEQAVADVEAERAKAAAEAAAKAAAAKAATPAPAATPVAKTETALDKITQFVNSKLKLNKKQSTSKLSALGKYIFQKSGGRVLTQTASWELARLLGIAGTPSTLAAWNKLSASKRNSIKALTLTAVKKAGYKKGVLNLSEDELAWTNENWHKDGSELIVSKRDGAILTPLKAGDSVIPANLAENLFKWGAIDPSMLHDKFVSKLPSISSMSTTMQAPVTIESIITVNGNVDESVMPQLEELGKQLANNLNFQRDMTKVISHNLYKDAKKQGYRK